MDIKDFVKTVAAVAKEKGWWENEDRNFGEVIALIHSELSEALEEWRKPDAKMFYMEENKPEGVLVELADVFIRIGDLVGNTESMGAEFFELVLKEKMAYNLERPHRHGGKRA